MIFIREYRKKEAAKRIFLILYFGLFAIETSQRNRGYRKILKNFRKEQMGLNVGAASSREINCRGWKPLPQKDYPMSAWIFQINTELYSDRQNIIAD